MGWNHATRRDSFETTSIDCDIRLSRTHGVEHNDAVQTDPLSQPQQLGSQDEGPTSRMPKGTTDNESDVLSSLDTTQPEGLSHERVHLSERSFETSSSVEVLDESISSLMPSTTVTELLSSSLVSATSLPRAEILALTISSRGQYVLAVSSSHLYLINVGSVPHSSEGTFAFRHRPMAVDLHDDGYLLAVLSSEHLIHIYRLRREDGGTLECTRTVHLTFPCRSISISPDGLVLVAIQADRHGVEFISVTPDSNSNDRRSVRCDAFDYGIFSLDSRTFIGSTFQVSGSASVILSVDLLDALTNMEGMPPPEQTDKAWTRRILFPKTIRDTHHASLMARELRGPAEFVLAAESNNAGHLSVIDLSTMQPTQTRFTLISNASVQAKTPKLCNTSPAISPCGRYLAVAVKEDGLFQILAYDLVNRSECNGEGRMSPSQGYSEQSIRHPSLTLPIPALADTAVADITDLKWQSTTETGGLSNVRLCLIVVIRVLEERESDDSMLFNTATVAGRILMIEFDDGQGKPVRRLNMSLDEALPVGGLLDEELDLETEVELARRRTVASKRRQPWQSQGNSRHSVPVHDHSLDHFIGPQRSSETRPDLETEERQAALEAPYSHAQPRSRLLLQRAATVAAGSSANRRHLQALPSHPLEYRRDGRPDPPHESDADNWVPPPPPYTREADPPSGMARLLSASTLPRFPDPSAPTQAFGPAIRSGSLHVTPGAPVPLILPATSMRTTHASRSGNLHSSQTARLTRPIDEQLTARNGQGSSNAVTAPAWHPAHFSFENLQRSQTTAETPRPLNSGQRARRVQTAMARVASIRNPGSQRAENRSRTLRSSTSLPAIEAHSEASASAAVDARSTGNRRFRGKVESRCTMV